MHAQAYGNVYFTLMAWMLSWRSLCFINCVVLVKLQGLLRAFASRSPSSSASNTNEPSIPHQLMAGGVSGIVACGIIYPLDVVKTRIQSLPVGEPVPPWAKPHRFLPDGGMLSVTRRVWAHDGMRGFWRGFWPCILPAFPSNAAGFFVYETVLRYWNN
jgi:hypothetical protein